MSLVGLLTTLLAVAFGIVALAFAAVAAGCSSDDEAGETLLTLTQERVPTESAREAHNGGWTGSLDNLETYRRG